MEIRDVEGYRRVMPFPDKWTQQEAAAVLDYWLRAVDAYVASDCDVAKLEQFCGSIGEFASGGDWLCHWVDTHGRDPQPLWDACLAVSNQLDGNGEGSEAIAQAFDRATPLFRWVLNPDHRLRAGGTGEQPALPVVRLDPPEVELNGKVFQVSDKQALAYEAMLKQRPERVGLTPIIGAHPERQMNNLPEELKAIVNTTNKGSRLLV